MKLKHSGSGRPQHICGIGIPRPEILKIELKSTEHIRRKRPAASSTHDLRAFSEDSSGSTADNWHSSLDRLDSGLRLQGAWSEQDASDDKAYSLRPRKQSKTNSLTARTKAEAAVDKAEQKMAQAAQLVMAVQTMCGNPSFAPVAPFEAARNDVCASPARCAASPDQQGQGPEHSQATIASACVSPRASGSVAKPLCLVAAGRQLVMASPGSGLTCLAEVLDVNTTTGRCRVLWQDGLDGWISPDFDRPEWVDPEQPTEPLHASCSGVPENMLGEELVGPLTGQLVSPEPARVVPYSAAPIPPQVPPGVGPADKHQQPAV
ncbi:hypothetical protein WJX84_004006 [Apatococcus fuscideae]|uniref:Uncharacterized protein n=1 Tax=Apatococcus fuscideae TaxID=2026836 RepID=A0AAW1SLN1_9CHLO